MRRKKLEKSKGREEETSEERETNVEEIMRRLQANPLARVETKTLHGLTGC